MTSVNVKNDFKISMCFMLLYRCLVGHVEVLIDDVGTSMEMDSLLSMYTSMRGVYSMTTSAGSLQIQRYGDVYPC